VHPHDGIDYGKQAAIKFYRNKHCRIGASVRLQILTLRSNKAEKINNSADGPSSYSLVISRDMVKTIVMEIGMREIRRVERSARLGNTLASR
jgi:hypothetical protein